MEESEVTPSFVEPQTQPIPRPPGWRFKYEEPADDEVCAWLVDVPRRQVCGDPAIKFVTVRNEIIDARVPVCDHHFRFHNLKARSAAG